MFKKTQRIPLPRRVLVVDQVVQGALLARIVLYGVCGLLYFSLIRLLDVAMTYPAESYWQIADRFFAEAIYWAPGMCVLLPVFAYELMWMSNRFVGPVVRLRGEMRRLIRGNDVGVIEFRVDDYWSELADDFNQLREEVVKLREQLDTARKSASVKTVDTSSRKAVRKGSLFAAKQAAEASGQLLESVDH